MTDREFQIHVARVYLTEAARRRHQNVYWTLIAWAQNARRRAAAVPATPQQGTLFV